MKKFVVNGTPRERTPVAYIHGDGSGFCYERLGKVYQFGRLGEIHIACKTSAFDATGPLGVPVYEGDNVTIQF